jgi:hypothetical protein
MKAGSLEAASIKAKKRSLELLINLSKNKESEAKK